MTSYLHTVVGWRRGVVVSGVCCMNGVSPRRARLVHGSVTVFGQVYHLGICYQPTRSTQPCIPPSLNRVARNVTSAGWQVTLQRSHVAREFPWRCGDALRTAIRLNERSEKDTDIKMARQREAPDRKRESDIHDCIGGGAYWAGWAAARPLFGSCGPRLSLARPLFWVM